MTDRHFDDSAFSCTARRLGALAVSERHGEHRDRADETHAPERRRLPVDLEMASLQRTEMRSVACPAPCRVGSFCHESTSAGDELNDSAQGGQNRHTPDR